MNNKFIPRMEELSFCPVCNSANFKVNLKPDICKCGNCKVFFRNPRPSEATIIACYDRGETFTRWQNELKIREYLWKKRLSLISAYCKSGTLLDIGAGDGYFLDFAKNIFSVEATEVSVSGVEYAVARGHNVHYGTIFDSKFNNKKYDVITMWHVLEHLSEPDKALRRITNILKPHGLLVIAVPNEISHLYSPAALQKKNPFGKLKCSEEIHLLHFTPRILTDILKNQFGLDVLELGVDDVHIHKRKQKLPGMYLNQVLCKLFGSHIDAAMVIVCSKAIKPL